jgi:hypothetical protein
MKKLFVVCIFADREGEKKFSGNWPQGSAQSRSKETHLLPVRGGQHSLIPTLSVIDMGLLSFFFK